METVKAIHAWMHDKIGAYPNVVMGLWLASIILVVIGMWS